MKDSTQRFSNRVDNYIKYRPSYPTEIVNLLSSKLLCDLTHGFGLIALFYHFLEEVRIKAQEF